MKALKITFDYLINIKWLSYPIIIENEENDKY